jgi:hypothetical protein
LLASWVRFEVEYGLVKRQLETTVPGFLGPRAARSRENRWIVDEGMAIIQANKAGLALFPRFILAYGRLGGRNGMIRES